ncbi:hypothetical protein AB6G58_19375 [Providencia huaxiensis]
MFDRLLFVLFNIQPKPLAYTVTIDIHGDRYTIHSQKPVTITEKDSGYIQIKALGKMHIFCGKMLHISVKKNTTLVTIGWSKGKSQIFEVKKTTKTLLPTERHPHQIPVMSPQFMKVPLATIPIVLAIIFVQMIIPVLIAHHPIQGK